MNTRIRHDYAKPDPHTVADWLVNSIALALLLAGIAWRLI